MAVLPPGVATFFFLVLKGPWLDRNEVKNIELKGLRFNNPSKKWQTGHQWDIRRLILKITHIYLMLKSNWEFSVLSGNLALKKVGLRKRKDPGS